MTCHLGIRMQKMFVNSIDKPLSLCYYRDRFQLRGGAQRLRRSSPKRLSEGSTPFTPAIQKLLSSVSQELFFFLIAHRNTESPEIS